jgi:hypothetical protein
MREREGFRPLLTVWSGWLVLMAGANTAVVATGLLDLRFSLSVSVGAVALVLVASSLSAAAWQAAAH